MTGLIDRFRRLGGRGTPACSHLDQIREVAAPANRCEACVAIGSTWVELRQCLACGQVGCCDLSPNRHARAHFTDTGHAIMRADLPGYTWTWCWVDEIKV